MLDQLIQRFQKWCAEQNLPVMSADELVCEDFTTLTQKSWLMNFIAEWEAAEDEEF
jgi:hypothetical protein